jgi:phosphoribosylanthranilate isomerase
MAPTRIKICGITRPEDGVAAAELGVDAIGLVFYELSARAVNTDRARAIKEALPPFVTVVGLFVNADPATVMAIIDAVSPHVLQFHGDEDCGYCEAFGLPFIKAVPMGGGATVAAYEDRFPTASALLLDSHGGTETGGSGKRFDWSRIPRERRRPLILAGGLNPDNVALAVAEVRPFAVDVSSGVESAKGIKDPVLMAAFVQGIKRGETSARD